MTQASELPSAIRVPRDADDDYTEHMAERRRGFIQDKTNKPLQHVAHYSLEPSTLRGNVENFIGVAQVPIGLVGPLHIRGEHARGEVYVPLATTEGALVASFNRGMRLLGLPGGVKTTLVEEAMQRSRVVIWISFHLDSLLRASSSSACDSSGNGDRKSRLRPPSPRFCRITSMAL